MLFYAFKMAVSIAFLCENTVEVTTGRKALPTHFYSSQIKFSILWSFSKTLGIKKYIYKVIEVDLKRFGH